MRLPNFLRTIPLFVIPCPSVHFFYKTLYFITTLISFQISCGLI
jgi:hypothetical protein